ncbi:LysR substrate-binding domain-containing protein [Erythrobacter mangrovi]|uniref:LysR family transcriptional regulator n=1 Tax=Erythrobacter mangrovi TaxID=2739433 RepID=A0A7D4BC18_9SPHN|nr:LysR substrate-binding domain-containing protein [Erythrobacter mangrovi]QKG72386.1 LysR family transcriptional regulator [Erythrobacter mangrovi]
MPALQAFERAAARSSFADAARDLGRTPSAVSHAIKDMETRLGVTLFERVGRTVRVTQAGAAYLEVVEAALSSLRAATQRIARSEERNVIRISALPFFTSAVLLPNLPRFEAAHPHYDLRIETTNAYADVLNGEVDIALRFGEERSENLICKPLISVCGQPVASPSYLRSAPPIREPSDLQQHTLIHVRSNVQAWDEWYRAMGGDRLGSTRNLSFDSILGALDAATKGLGIALGMYPLIGAHSGYGEDLVPVLGPAVAWSTRYNFICQRTALESRKIQATLKWLEDSLAAFV